MEARFPPSWAETWDRFGLQIGDPNQEVKRVGITLESHPRSIAWAIQNDLQLLISHHPLFFEPLTSLENDQEPGRTATRIIKAGISLLVAHTNLDASPDGVSTALANRLGLTELRPLQQRFRDLVKLVLFVPLGYEEKITRALEVYDAGRIGPYRLCTFKCRGEGTYIPEKGSHPFQGEINRLQRVSEWRLEVLIPRTNLSELTKAIREVHPYDEMAYDVYPVAYSSSDVGIGRIGVFDPPVSGETLIHRLKKELDAPSVKVSGGMPDRVRKIAVCGGSGGRLIPEALTAGIEIFICGEIGYHPLVSFQGQGMTLIEIGHYPSEKWVIPVLAEMLREADRAEGWGVEVFENLEAGDPYSRYY